MARKRTALALAGLYTVGAFLLLVLQADRTLPQPPPTTVPASDPGGRVVADDETPWSPPYRHYAGSTTPQPASRQPEIIASIQPSQPASKPERKQQRRQELSVAVVNEKEYPMRRYEPLLVPNDPSANQWWVTNSKLTQSWDVPAGGNETLLAVIDTGFALQHEEFAGRWHSNTGETGAAGAEQASALNCTDRGLGLWSSCNLIDDDADGIVDNGENWDAWYENPSRLNCTDQGKPLAKDCNRIDDDANGYIDDYNGWDFASNDNLPQAGELNPAGDGTVHGTRVAGLAAATGNNNKGIAGVDWQTRILPIQALDDDSYGDTLGVGRAIYYAVAQGADVISISLGSDYPDNFVREAIHLAIAAGIIVVAASGNDGCDCMVYPARYPEVLAVGAINSSNLPASFSSYGSNLDIVAPGTALTSTSWTAAGPTNSYASNIQGTSYATPIVSGMLSRLISNRPEATPLQLMAALVENVNRLSLTGTTARSDTLGYGSLDAQKSAERMATARNPDHLYTLSPVSRGGRLTPDQPVEEQADYYVQPCMDDQVGTMPIYEMTKGASRFYTISEVETYLASTNGYVSGLFARACLSQPHDTPGTIRNLDIPREFRNLYDKP